MTEVTSYEKVFKAYPDLVAQVVAKLRRGRSKFKNADPSVLKWTYEYCYSIQCLTFKQVLGNLQNPPPPKPVQTVDEEVADYLRSCTVWIQASKSSFWANSEKLPTDPPPSWLERVFRERCEAQRKKDAEFADMNQGTKDKHVQGLLAQLSGQPGFMALRIGK